jgi:uncharacterized protein
VLEKYPTLRICIAHLGGFEELKKYIKDPDQPGWTKDIIEFCTSCEVIYTDISFSLGKKIPFKNHLGSKKEPIEHLIDILTNNKKFCDKVLFGSDYYMNEVVTNEKRFSEDLKDKLNNAVVTQQIAQINPEKWLNG